MSKINLTNTNFEKQNTMKLNEIQEMILMLKGTSPTQSTITTLLTNVQTFFTTAIETLSSKLIDPNVDTSVDYASLEQRLNGLLDELSEEHSNIMSQFTDDTSDLSATLTAMQQSIITAFEQIDLSTISTALATVDSVVDNISTAISTIDTTLDTMNTTVSNVSTSLGNVSTNISNIGTTVNSINTAVASLQTAVSGISSDIESLDNTTLTTQITGISDQIDDVLTAINNLGGTGTTEPPYDPAPTVTYTTQTTFTQFYTSSIGVGTVSSYKEYFTCNDGQNILIRVDFLFTTTATMPNSFIKVFMNEELIYTEPIDIVPVTNTPIYLHAMATTTRTDNEIHVIVEGSSSNSMTISNLTYTVQGKNVSFLFTHPMYQVVSNNANYRIIKRIGREYYYLDTLQDPLDLSGEYTFLVNKIYYETPIYLNTYGAYPGPSIPRTLYYYMHDHFNRRGILQNSSFVSQIIQSGCYPCDAMSITSLEQAIYMVVSESDTTFKVIKYRTDSQAITDLVTTQTMDEMIIDLNFVRNHFTRYSSVKEPIPIIQLRNGRNYAYIPSVSTLIYIGYGTKVSAGFSSSVAYNSDFKAYMKEYNHWKCVEVTVTETTATVTNTTIINTDYEEMHPGIDNDLFIVSSGIISRLST